MAKKVRFTFYADTASNITALDNALELVLENNGITYETLNIYERMPSVQWAASYQVLKPDGMTWSSLFKLINAIQSPYYQKI